MISASVDVLYFSEAFLGWDGIERVIWMFQQTGQARFVYYTLV